MVVEFVFKGIHGGKVRCTTLAMSLVQKDLVQLSCMNLHLSFTCYSQFVISPSFENNLFASTFIYLLIFSNTLEFPWRRHFSKENMFCRASLSSSNLLHKDKIIFIALCWIGSNFAMSFARLGDQNCTAYSKWGLTKLMCRGKIVFLFLDERFLFMKLIIVLSLSAASLLGWENFRF